MNPHDVELLIRDKYNDARTSENEVVIAKDIERLAAGEPLAYVIGWIPFLQLRINLASSENPEVRALIPRSETEWWTEKLILHLREKFGDRPFSLLDLCAGSGAIGLSILKAFPNATVTFAEIVPELAELIKENQLANGLGEAHASVVTSDLFGSIPNVQFDIIATNPPYIPEDRELDKSVIEHEPRQALFSGTDGMTVINQIIDQASQHLLADGELWIECDISNIHEAEKRASAQRIAAHSLTIHEDLSGRPRLLVAHF